MTEPPDAPAARVAGGGTPKTKVWLWVAVAVAVAVVGFVVWAYATEAEADFDVESAEVTTSAAGRVEVAMVVRNEGPDAGAPTCQIEGRDADGILVESESVTLDPIEPGDTLRASALTTVMANETTATGWTVGCELD